MSELGLIAGSRKFPLIFARAARDRGYKVVAFAVRGDAWRAINKCADKVVWLRLREFGRLGDIMKREGINEVVMAGQISPGRLFSSEVMRDAGLREVFAGMKDKRADTIFSTVIRHLEKSGVKFLDSTAFLGEMMPERGLLCGPEPSPEQSKDIEFGFKLAKEVAGFDIGQTVAVKSGAIVGVEAFEGTDNLIRRAGKIAGRGFTVVKVSKPRQDPRFDVPVVGLCTVKTLLRCGAACLAIEAGKTLFIDKEASLAFAERKGLIITAV